MHSVGASNKFKGLLKEYATRALLIAACWIGLALPTISNAHGVDSDDIGAVFVMTNNADDNKVIAYERGADGTLHNPHAFKTGGRGSGGTIDPIASQGSLTLSEDNSLLFAVNAGSGEISVFRVHGSQLWLVDRVPSGGSEPNAIAQHGNLVYVLNTAGSSSVVGFRLHHDRLVRIPDSLRFLSQNGANSASIAFSPNGQFLLVTERAKNNIDAFHVQGDGTLSPIVVNPSAGPGAFSVNFAPNGVALVSETGSGAPNGSAMSSYALQADATLTPISTSVPALANANCWNAVTPDGHFVYTSNAGSANISGFSISISGALTPLSGTIVGTNPTGATNLDIAISSDGNFLYSLNSGDGTVGMFGIKRDGTLVRLGSVGGLQAAAGFNGIAAK
jgi:6-phosphogluconolactonase